MAHLSNKREGLKEQWATGGLASPRTDEMAIQSAAAQGACSVLEDILSIDFVELNGEGDE